MIEPIAEDTCQEILQDHVTAGLWPSAEESLLAFNKKEHIRIIYILFTSQHDAMQNFTLTKYISSKPELRFEYPLDTGYCRRKVCETKGSSLLRGSKQMLHGFRIYSVFLLVLLFYFPSMLVTVRSPRKTSLFRLQSSWDI